MSYFQQNHQNSFVNSVYHHHQQQESVNQTYQQQQQQQQYYQTTGINGYDSLSSTIGNPLNDHMDVPLMRTTTTIVHNTCQTQQQPSMPSTEIERIKLALERSVQFHPGSTMSDSSCLSSQYVTQTQLNEQFDPRLPKSMLNIK